MPASTAGSGINNNYDEYLQFLLVSGFVTNKAIFVTLCYVQFQTATVYTYPDLIHVAEIICLSTPSID